MLIAQQSTEFWTTIIAAIGTAVSVVAVNIITAWFAHKKANVLAAKVDLNTDITAQTAAAIEPKSAAQIQQKVEDSRT